MAPAPAPPAPPPEPSRSPLWLPVVCLAAVCVALLGLVAIACWRRAKGGAGQLRMKEILIELEEKRAQSERRKEEAEGLSVIVVAEDGERLQMRLAEGLARLLQDEAARSNLAIGATRAKFNVEAKDMVTGRPKDAALGMHHYLRVNMERLFTGISPTG